jgi:hypothetical protein
VPNNTGGSVGTENREQNAIAGPLSDPKEIPESLVRKSDDGTPNSLLDLVGRGTISLELAGWLVAQVSRGASYIVGAGPGGIGKTTTMQSLLSFVPSHLPFAIARPGEIEKIEGGPTCVVSNELSSHPVESYLWGEDLRDFFRLSDWRHHLVGNMHVDTLAETHDQVCEQNGVPEDQFRAVDLLIFIGVDGAEPGAGRIKDTTLQRFVAEIVRSDGSADHKQVYTRDGGFTDQAPRDPDFEARCCDFLQSAINDGLEDIRQVRERFLSWEHHPQAGG